MSFPKSDSQTLEWKSLYLAGGYAALLAGVIFRRNIGAEVSLFATDAIPESAAGWFRLLENNPFVAIAYLDFFDIIDYALVGLMFLAVCVLLWKKNKSAMLVGTAAGLMGIAVNFAANITFSMLHLSQQFRAAATETLRASVITSGQAVLSFNNPSAIFQGTGDYLSLLLIAIGSLIFSVAMLGSREFHRVTGIVGLLASGCDLAYCVTFSFAPSLRVVFLPVAGLFYMIWHIMIGIRLLKLGREVNLEEK